MTQSYVLALDLGTTGNRAIVFNREGQIIAQAYRELTQHYPKPGWLEHDPIQIWKDTHWAIETAIRQAKIAPDEIAAMGLTVQRETCLLWDKTTGEPLHRAIVWQDRRTADLCHQLRDRGVAADVQAKTGLVLDAYFSATKLKWLLDWVKASPKYADLDLTNVLAGTIDSWVLWNLTGRAVHATDHSNASRTMLMNLAQQDWDESLLALFEIPPSLMPEIRPSLGDFGQAQLGDTSIPVRAIFGDQQAALFAHGCNHPGLIKCTYGTGAFLVTHTGTEIVRSQHQLLSTIAWTQTGHPAGYAIEGSMFTAGACIQWLRDGLNLIQQAAETSVLADQVPDNNGVYFVPALSGLGAPHWDMSARGAFFGLTGGVQRAHMVRAVLEAIAYQVRDVVQAVNDDCDRPVEILKVDGGACQNDFLMQYQADVLGIPVERPAVLEATAQGAGFGAGLMAGLWSDYSQLIESRAIDRVFEPSHRAPQVQQQFQSWIQAVERTKNWTD
ncbi:glycerol kinase GlpK [Lyngbya confervoides]|uniref:Glycerol kinase n=1 Tax=Lyngbya confervoides BDU141951 TaxID=1574623 RepID=A0ABD4T4M1_9CYAN|nr:glycerol kinase GlpK [Lyngbya confervoides]MCM1983434.1 glycerol kinase GlpK [Lyngbya confervoides BDU141951]